MVELLGGALGLVEGLLRYAIPFVFVLSVVVVIHELGHYWVARFFKTRIDSFSIGFGGEIFGWTDKLGTRWKVSWLPLGGYVKFHGDDGPTSLPDQERLEVLRTHPDYAGIFHFKPLGQRAAIVAAGPIANFLLAIVVFAGVLLAYGETIRPSKVDSVTPGGVAEAAGFLPGDVIVGIDGRKIRSFSAVQRAVALSPGTEIVFDVRRGEEIIQIRAVPVLAEFEDPAGNTHKAGRIGIAIAPSEEDITVIRYNPATALWRGTERTFGIITDTFTYLGGMIAGNLPADQLGGPLRIAQVSGQVAAIDLVALIQWMGLLSVSIGLINLFPIPVLDGGHLLFYAYEAVAGRPLGEKAQEIGFRIGLALVLMLLLFATWNDLTQLKVFGS